MSKIIVIVGPTGVGKTKLSIDLAHEYNASIISADSVQVIKEFNIGSAKIREEEKQNIPHYMIDIKSIEEDYSVFDYQRDAREILDKLIKEDKNVIIVGGTGLYIKALLYDYKFDTKNDTRVSNKTNKKLYDFVVIGLTSNREKIYQIINDRVEDMFKNGLLEEARVLKSNKKTDKIIGYKELNMYFNNLISLEEVKELIKKNTRNYAKRQYTWNNNQFDTNWFEVNFNDFSSTTREIIDFLNKIW